MIKVIEPAANKTTRIWATVITTLGMLCFAYFGWGTVDGIVRLQTDPDIRYSPMVEPFTILFGLVTLVSLRLAARRAWAGLVLALLGWYGLYDIFSFPLRVRPTDFIYGAVVLLLTTAILMGEDAWKGGV